MAITYSTTAVLGLALTSIYLAIAFTKAIWTTIHSPLNAAPPAHWSAKYTGFWIWWQRVRERDAQAVHSAHVRLGPVLRLGPNELSIIDVEGGTKPIYDGRMPKTDFYDVATAYGEAPMVAIRGDKEHQQRKRLVAKPYGKSFLVGNVEWHAEQAKLAEEFVATVDRLSQGRDGEVDVYDVFFAWALAAISAYVFGWEGRINFLDDISEARRVRDAYFKQRAPQFVSAVLPMPLMLREMTGHAPEIRWMWQAQDRAEKALRTSSTPETNRRLTAYTFMRKSLTPSSWKNNRPNLPLTPKEEAILASEMQDHMIAGIDTSVAALTAAAWMLSLGHNRHWQDRLREEVQQISLPADGGKLDQLPVLDAVVKEALRLFPPQAGAQPRVTDKIAVLGPPGREIAVPAGVKVSVQAQTLHRSSIFEDPEEFRPDRWVDASPEKRREMERWFLAFGAGTRRCVGEHLALSNIKVGLAALFQNFETAETKRTKFAVAPGIMQMPLPDADGNYLRVHAERLRRH